MVPASRDTMLWTVPRRAVGPVKHPCVIDIDDWAFRRGQRCGTLVCDLERRRVIALLPDGESCIVEAWLAAHPEITVVAHNRGGCYGKATTRVLPHALQVADRWHLMENVNAAFLDAVRKSMAAIRVAAGAATGDPEWLTWAERLQYDGYFRKEATGKAILALSRQGMPIKKIARATGHSRKLVRNVLRRLTGNVFRARQSSFYAYLPRLNAEWAAGCRNWAELWRRLRASGLPAVCGWSGNGRGGGDAASACRTDRTARCRRRPSSPG